MQIRILFQPKSHPKENSHSCKFPDADEFSLGTVAQCECNQYAKVVKWDGIFGIHAWKYIRERKALKILTKQGLNDAESIE